MLEIPLKWTKDIADIKKFTPAMIYKNMSKYTTEYALVMNASKKVTEKTFQFFNPENIATIEEATVFLSNVDNVRNGMNLRFYRAIFDVYNKGLYKKAAYFKGKGIEYCANIAEYCEKCINPPIARSQAYNACNVGELITTDGAHSIFYKGEGKDFSFTQLLAIVEGGKGKLFEDIKDGKKVIGHKYVMADKWLRATNVDGSLAFKADKYGIARPYFTKVDGEKMRLIDLLILMEYITPAISVAKIKQFLKDDFEITENGVKHIDKNIIDLPDTTDDTTDDTPDTTDDTPDTTDDTPDTTDDTPITTLYTSQLHGLLEMLNADDIEGAKALIKGWLNA